MGNKDTKRSVKNELLRVMSVISIITIILVGSISSLLMFGQSYGLARSDMQFYTNNISARLSNHLRFVEETVLYLRKSEEMKTFFRNSQLQDKDTLLSSMESGINLFSEWNMVEEIHPFLKDVYVLNQNMQSLDIHFYLESSGARDRQRERIIQELEAYRESGELFRYKKYGNDIEIYFSLYDDYLREIGYGAAVINGAGMQKIFSGLSRYADSHFILTDKEGRHIFGSNIEAFVPTEQVYEEQINIGGKAYFYSGYSYGFAFRSHILIPTSALYQNILPVFGLAWFFVFFVFAVSILLIFYYADKLTRPLQTIVYKLRELGKGDFSTRLDDSDLQEFHAISESFNDMTDKIDKLIIQVYKNELMAKEARLQYLQAQINPHFLFNVLSMISLRSKMNKDEETYRMVHSLAGLMQGKIFRKNEIEIPLQEEIKIAEFYLYLSGERFKDRIRYAIHWESEDLKDCMVPKLCIEPIVENAVIHGLEPKVEKGSIKVDIRRQGEKLVVTVEDDGIGFDTQKAYDDQASRHPRVGLMNIRRLIQNLYGNDYGMRVESRLGKGSKVEIILPYTKEKLI